MFPVRNINKYDKLCTHKFYGFDDILKIKIRLVFDAFYFIIIQQSCEPRVEDWLTLMIFRNNGYIQNFRQKRHHFLSSNRLSIVQVCVCFRITLAWLSVIGDQEVECIELFVHNCICVIHSHGFGFSDPAKKVL